MKVRFHRGTLADSMATVFEPKNYKEFLDKCSETFGNFIDKKSIVCELYSDIPDNRIGWKKTYIISAVWKNSKNPSPIAFSDEDINELDKSVDLLEVLDNLTKNYNNVCDEIHWLKARGSSFEYYMENVKELETIMSLPRMKREPRDILCIAKKLVNNRDSALAHEKDIRALREKRNSLKKNIDSLKKKISEC